MNTETRERVKLQYSGENAEAYDKVRLEDPPGALLSDHDLKLFFTMFPAEQGGMRMLEVGAGTGRFTVPVVERGFSLTATDVNQDMLTQLDRKLEGMGLGDRCETKIEDVFNISFEDGSFEFVFGIHLYPRLRTVEDQRAALLETARIVKPGGRLLFNYRNARSLNGLIHRGPRNTPKNISSVLEEAGMRIVRQRGKWLMNKRALQTLPMPINRLIARVDRALWSFMPSSAWDVFVLAEKTEPA